MLAPTHSVFGIFLTLIFLAVFGIQLSLHWSIILVAILGAIMPDIDHPSSVIGRTFPFISIPLERRYGHRTITHSFIGWAVASLIFAFFVLIGNWILGSYLSFDIGNWTFPIRWIAAFSISYFSHLILDMFNKTGVQMFWPDTSRDVLPKNPKFRTVSGSREEIWIFIVLFFLMLLAFPISKYGIASSLRWLFATPGSAMQEYKTMKTRAYLEFTGVFSDTKEPIEGVGEILDVKGSRMVILYNNALRLRGSTSSPLRSGQAIYTIGDELSADILASHVRTKGTSQPIIVTKKEFKDESRDALLEQIPAGALVSGTVHLPDGMDIKFPVYSGSFKPMSQKGNDLILNFATKKQIEGLSLTESYELLKKKDRVALEQLNVQADDVRNKMKELESGGGLTALGKELMQNKEEMEKQRLQRDTLKSQLDEINVKIEELRLKMKARKFAFSGEVYLRK
jgi:inner membrane protein